METLIEDNGTVLFQIDWTEVTEHSVNFNVYKVTSWYAESGEISDSEHYLRGYVKWDGCSHFWFGDEGYIHLCGKGCFDKHVLVMQTIWDACSKKITKFNHEVAGL